MILKYRTVEKLVLYYINMSNVSKLLNECKKGNARAIQKLLDAGTNVNDIDSVGTNAIMLASNLGHSNIVKILLDYGANVNSKSSTIAWTPLMIALRSRHITDTSILMDIVTTLLNRGGDPNLADWLGVTVLMYSSFKGYTEIVKQLLAYNANIDATDKDGSTALMYACEKGYIDIAQALLEKGANMNAKNNDGNTAIMVGSLYDHIDIVRLLLELEADIEVKNMNGKTALTIAKFKGHQDIVQLLENPPLSYAMPVAENHIDDEDDVTESIVNIPSNADSIIHDDDSSSSDDESDSDEDE